MDNACIYTVSALTEAVRNALEGTFPFVWVRGQVVNLARPQSGHLYFSLRDEESSLAAVWFKGQQKDNDRFDPLTGEVYEDGPRPGPAASLENGQELICAGRLRLYAPRGIYQLVVEMAQKTGLGRLHEEFERLRRHLAGLGYFAPERKRPLPENPARVAVITAPTSAALTDFLRIAQDRGTGACLHIHPSPVQGDAAPAGLIAALERVIAEGWAQVVVFLRGGGSLEDLWAF
ncbi:MAG: exodeoxyribonuclease VII large subunit, partial [Desulfovibrio sp.]|nr:exodeoxyribonuclease VII large subunit [Desulfovibrio sp.]